MNYRKLRFLSVVCAASLLASQGAVIASCIDGDGTDYSSGYTQTNALPIKADDLFISITEKEYDGTLTAEASITSDLIAGKDVTISANSVFKNKDVGKNKAVVLNDFSLSGEDKDSFCLDIDSDIEVYSGTITQKAIKLIPNDKQQHYTTDDYTNGIAVGVTYDESQIYENDNVYDIPDNIYIISYNNDYVYSLENSYLITERTLDNKNYKVYLPENAKPDVSEPDKPILNDAELEPADGGVKISYYDDIGFVSNGKVRIKVSAKPVYGESLAYYIKSDQNGYEETPLDDTTFEADTKDEETYRKTDISCAAEGFTKSDYKPLVYKYNSKRSETLIIDKEVPSQKQGNELSAAADNSNQRFLINGKIQDNGSGIKSIKYSWTKDSKSYRKNVDVKAGTNEVKFNNSYLFDYSQMPDNNKVVFRITDLADNYCDITVNLDDSGYIIAKPEITSIKLTKDGLTKLDDFLHILSFGIYSNNVLTLKIRAEASSGDLNVSKKNVTVSLIDTHSNSLFTDVKTLNDDAEDGVITFILGEDENTANKLSVKVENEYGQYKVSTLRELLQTVPNKSNAQWNNKTTNTNSDKWVFDKTPPEISVNLDNAYDNRYYIDSSTRSVNISANDEMSGISDLHVYNQSVYEYIVSNESGSELLIEDEYNEQYRITNIESSSITIKNINNKEEKKLDISRIENTDSENMNTVRYEVSDSSGTYYADGCEIAELRSNSGKYELISKDIDDTEYKYDIVKRAVEIEQSNGNEISSVTVSADNFVMGSNKLYVTAADNAGNTSEKTFDVYLVDKTPEGEISFVSPYTHFVDSKTWILERDFNNSSGKKASVKMMLKNETSSINYVDISLNGISVYRKTNTFFSNELYNDIKNNNGVINIELDDETISSIKASDNYKNNNRIHIQAVMKTSIYNFNSDISETTVYVDKKDPVITKFEVADRNRPLDKIVNILSFGIFHNDDLTLCIYTEDGVNDSGIDKAEISFEGKDNTPKLMNYDESKNCYTYSIPKGTEVFSSGISVTVTDKLGNKTKEMPSASNTDEANRKEFPTNFVMIEANKPAAALSSLDGDYHDSNNVWFHEKDFAGSDIDKNRSYVLSAEDKDSGIRKIDAVLTTKNGGKTIKCTPSDKPFKGSSYDPDSKITAKTDYLFSVDDLAARADNVDGEYTLKVTITDNAGNVSDPVSVTFNRDITAPGVTGIEFLPVSQNEKAGTTEFIDQNESIVKTNYGYYFKEEFSIKVKASDLNISSGLKCAEVTLLKYNSDGTYTQQEVKTANFKTGTGSGENIQGVSEEIVIPKGFKGMFLVKASDNTSNVSKGRSPRSFVIDNEKPDISIKSDHDPLQNVTDSNGNSIYTDDVNFKVTITDTKSGIKEIYYNSSSENTNNSYNTQDAVFIGDSKQYKVNDIINGWKVMSVDLNIVTCVEKTFTYGDESDGKDIIGKFKAVDNSNNTNANETFKFTIDRIAPEIMKMYLNTSDGAEAIDFSNSNKLEYRVFYKDKFSVTTEAFDAEPSSGLNKMDYRFVTYDTSGKAVNNDTSVKDVKIVSNKTENVQIPNDFQKGQIFVKAYDNTEKNISDEKKTVGVVIDNNAPEITIDKLPITNSKNNAADDKGNVLYNNPKKVSFKVTIEDTESGLKSIDYKKTSEKVSTPLQMQTAIDVVNSEYAVGAVIGNAEDNSDWTIESMDHNLITKVSRVFTFTEDDKNILFSFSASDRSDNTSGKKESQSFTIDTKAPTVTGISFSKESADGITEIKPEEFIEKLEYGYYFKDEIIITADCEDARPSSGLKMMTFRFVPYKDGEQIEDEEYSEPKQSDVEDIVISKKVVDGKASCTVKKGFKGQIFVTAYDYAAFYYRRNTSKEITTQAFVIEDTIPEIQIDELPETELTDDLGNKLYTDKVAFKVTISDTESGLREITYANRSDNIKDNEELEKEYSLKIDNLNEEYDIDYTFEDTGWTIEKMDNNLVTQVSQTFVFEKDDKNICMIFSAVDRANNETEEVTSEKFTIDTVAPTIERFNFEPASEDDISEIKDFIEELEYGFYFKKPFTATVSVDDKIPSSGLETVVFRLVSFDKGEQISEETYAVPVENKKASYLIPQGFKGQIYAQVNDRAKNTSNEQTPQGFVVEENPPIIKIDPLPDNNDKNDMNGNKLYTHGVQFRVTVTDDKSGLRSVSYSKNSEKDSFGDVVTQIDNITKYEEGDTLDNGWQIVKMDKNLITEISQVFSFDSDDNYIVMTYQATDRSKNVSGEEKSECFTIDTTAPIVRMSYPAPVNGGYYKDSVTFNISITERNFDPALMTSIIKDSFRSNNNIQIAYSSSSSTEHTASVIFPEGDYEFTYSGEDRGGNQAQIYGSGGDYSSSVFSEMFNVDATSPVITTNFDDLVVDGKKEYYFNSNQTVEIDVTEHNFYADDMGITFEKKAAGSGHAGNSEGWYSIGGFSDKWNDDPTNPDHHVLSIELNEDAIYRVKIRPHDRAGNEADPIDSSVFEIDKEAPHLVSRNGIASDTKGFVESPFIDIYDEKRKDDPAPVLTFDDNNYDKMVIKATVLKTKYIESNQIIGMETDDLSKTLSKTTSDKTFDLSGFFDNDGVYILSFTIYDKAGNVYETVNDTYFRMVKTDIIAYISNSDAKEHTGYYSLMDENQKAISKKASDFSDLDIVVVTKKTDNSTYSIEIKDNKDQQQYLADDFVTMKNSKIGESKAAVMKEFHLPGTYFSETFKDDSMDARMDLSVLYNNSTSYYLSKIHIDNEKPTAVLPEFFHSWGSMMFTDNVDVTLSSISEKLDISKTKIYECPRNGERKEIALSNDSYDEKEKSLTFSLGKGVHNIDITLADEAGNEWNIDRIRYFTVGNFWLYLGIGVVIGTAAVVTAVIFAKKHKKQKTKS